jgi:hypothetical protein
VETPPAASGTALRDGVHDDQRESEMGGEGGGGGSRSGGEGEGLDGKGGGKCSLLESRNEELERKKSAHASTVCVGPEKILEPKSMESRKELECMRHAAGGGGGGGGGFGGGVTCLEILVEDVRLALQQQLVGGSF